MSKLFSEFLIAALMLLAFYHPSHAHKASDAYLTLSEPVKETTVLTLSVALRDLDLALPSLDADNDREITWGEVKQSTPAIVDLLDSTIKLSCGASTKKSIWNFDQIAKRSDGNYILFRTEMDCPNREVLATEYSFLKNLDATHRLVITGSINGKSIAGVVSSTGDGKTILRDGSKASHPFTVLKQFVPIGVFHIATGFDHLAFLLALLLPLNVRNHLSRIIKIVTGFTVGHSVTLALATLGFIAPSNWVEPLIAISIGVTAALNLLPHNEAGKTSSKWLRPELLAIGFGLIHGLGFASIMSEAKLSPDLIGWALGGFNLGVEAGQLIAVAAWGLLASAILQWRHYAKVIIRGGSVVLIAVSLFWTVQRVAG